MARPGLPWLDAELIRSTLRPRAAVDALAEALRGGLDPSAGPSRSIVSMANGELLMMPAEYADVAGVKLATVAPQNPANGRPRVQGIFVLLDAQTLTPTAILDGIELTALRTPAVSLLAARDRLLARTDPLDILVFGVGPQAVRHVETTHDVLADHRALASVTYLCRHPARAQVPDIAGLHPRVLAADEAADLVASAGLIVCATTAEDPLFDGAAVRDDAIVLAVGAHHRSAREVDDALIGRSCVVVEEVATAKREAGDIALALESGALRQERILTLARAVCQPALVATDGPLFFKSVGMGWQDVVVARAVLGALKDGALKS